jgi:formylglycine-generating enzyme required for sulfatase activity
MKTKSMVQCVAGAVAIGVVAGCSLFGSSDGKTTDKVVPAVGGTGGTAGTGASAAQGASGGTVQVGGAGGGTGSGCSGLPGPAMVEVQAPGGAKFCVDRTEVTQAQYAEFLKATAAKPGSEHADCADNTSYAPKTNPAGPNWEPSSCTDGVVWTPEKTPNRPVVCVDWCDAYAYCAWAGKRLCGRVGGGRNAITQDPSSPATSAASSQWYAACSQGGKTLYPYGDTYDPKACEGHDAMTQDSGSGGQDPWSAKADVASQSGCHGTADPYSGLRDLSGSVMEFTDECMVDTTTPGQVLICGARGGGFLDLAGGLDCNLHAAYAQQSYGEDKGFRCCKDLP